MPPVKEVGALLLDLDAEDGEISEYEAVREQRSAVA